VGIGKLFTDNFSSVYLHAATL